MKHRDRLAYIALGANLGNREATFARVVEAIEAAAGLEIVKASPVFETAPLGPGPQGPYLNAVLCVRTHLQAFALLDFLLSLEVALGRDRSDAATRWGPRVIDLDILFLDDALIDSPGLVVPHPRVHERVFVLAPMAALDAEFQHPVLHRTMRELAQELPDRDSVRPVANPLGWPV